MVKSSIDETIKIDLKLQNFMFFHDRHFTDKTAKMIPKVIKININLDINNVVEFMTVNCNYKKFEVSN